jgi:hypothetical protein
MVYLTRRALDGLKAYQYKSSGYTILDHMHAPYLNCKCKADAVSKMLDALAADAHCFVPQGLQPSCHYGLHLI